MKIAPPPDTLPRAIQARGVRHNTLRDLDVDVPLWRTVVIAGVSGSGKTSLAMGTLYAEGLHRFLEGLSTYSRRRLTQAERPDVDRIDHLPPALALRQRPPVPGPRSTVGTMSEVLNVLRLIMSRLGTHRCPNGHDVKPSIATQAMEIQCPVCGATFAPPSAESFAFNSIGACPGCNGIGTRFDVDTDSLVPDPDKTIGDGAVLPWNVGGRRLSMYAAGELGVRLDVPYRKLTRKEKDFVLHGKPVKQPVVVSGRNGRQVQLNVTYDNAITAAEKSENSKYLISHTCPVCHGTRLRPEALTSRLNGRNLAQISALDLDHLVAFANELPPLMPPELSRMTTGLLGELTGAIGPLLDLGLGYLGLDRAGATLSTGERQRIELTSTVRANTTGMLYVLDEPSVGLHPSNVEGLRKTIAALAGNGNTVVIVEHDLDLIRSADWVIELGPGAGRLGGQIVAEGAPDQLQKNRKSIIGPFLDGRLAVDRPPRPLPRERATIAVRRLYNLRNVTVGFPINRLTALAGPSGAGKTALVLDSLIPAARAVLAGQELPAHVKSLTLGSIRQVVEIDATPIGLNARSTPSTYSGAFDAIRAYFGAASGRSPGHFSFNTKEGQCPTCRGIGSIDLDVQYLPDINVECPTCHGARFNDETLGVRVDGLTIADVLGLTVREAVDRYAAVPTIVRPLRPMVDVGLGYLRLGEPTPSLSGGESQRLRIAARLRNSQRNVLYVLDEPSTGLHPVDIRTLVGVFDRLLSDGATIIVIDHDLDVLAAGDHVFDMGPGGGPDGGRIVARGTPAEVAADPHSVTGPWLAAHLGGLS
ncbi:excinuclease ABC subunit A [Asanoa ferruginea]|uniref:UvrABC system protein A n=1 Tax=Asanoa ferruginea TaxID=53367 RepID=A0A3D9ZR97_9ACTN|nr:excinuclease ABC subunit UvrA [Asanoa ferruginea]REF99002.1 excinuclease ABC subunit A [Asanoa ferruginea]GIF46315.1 excinuclease ABC subunit A [Asanoa ferruginea]